MANTIGNTGLQKGHLGNYLMHTGVPHTHPIAPSVASQWAGRGAEGTHKGNEQCPPGLAEKQRWLWYVLVTPRPPPTHSPSSMQDNCSTKAKDHYPPRQLLMNSLQWWCACCCDTICPLRRANRLHCHPGVGGGGLLFEKSSVSMTIHLSTNASIRHHMPN